MIPTEGSPSQPWVSWGDSEGVFCIVLRLHVLKARVGDHRRTNKMGTAPGMWHAGEEVCDGVRGEQIESKAECKEAWEFGGHDAIRMAGAGGNRNENQQQH